jgi:hypothetical protein
MGYCIDGWWLNQQFCCWEIDGEEEGACEAWRTWSAYGPGRYLIYVLLAVSQPYLRLTRVILLDLWADVIFTRVGTPSRLFCEIRCWFRNIRNKVHIGWIRHARLLGAFDIGH